MVGGARQLLQESNNELRAKNSHPISRGESSGRD
jgi:hypothetical protein